MFIEIEVLFCNVAVNVSFSPFGRISKLIGCNSDRVAILVSVEFGEMIDRTIEMHLEHDYFFLYTFSYVGIRVLAW